MARRKRFKCKRSRTCDFSEYDHTVMERQHETCDDWRRKRAESREFIRRLKAKHEPLT